MEADILAYLGQKEFPSRPYSPVPRSSPFRSLSLARTLSGPSICSPVGLLTAGATVNYECQGCDRCPSGVRT